MQDDLVSISSSQDFTCRLTEPKIHRILHARSLAFGTNLAAYGLEHFQALVLVPQCEKGPIFLVHRKGPHAVK